MRCREEEGTALILRLFRGRAEVERAADVAGALSGEFLEAARSLPGLTSYAAGLRIDPDAARFLIASTWETFEQLAEQTGGTIERPVRLLDYMQQEGAEHYELVGEPMAILVAPPRGVVRLARMVIKTGREEEFYALVRERLEGVWPTGDLLAYHLGRRVDRVHTAVAVSVWRTPAALGELVRLDSPEPLWAASLTPLLERFDVEHFDAILVHAAD